MKNFLSKVLSIVMALTMIMGTFATIASAADVYDHKCVFDQKVGHQDATCITPGYDIYECECGETKTVAVSSTLAVCSGPFETVAAIEPTCTAPGFLAGERCTLCGKSSDKAIDPSKPALGHDYQLIIEDPQCGLEGKIYDQCVRCGDINGYSYVQDENGNNVYEIISSEFWTSDGQNQHTCERVGHDNRDYGYTLVQQPTCTENGVAKYGCLVEGCDAYVEVPVMAYGHNWAVAKYVAPDCEADGFRTYVCDYCDAVADADHPELVDDVNVWLKASGNSDETIKAIGAGKIPATGHHFVNIPDNADNCDCVVGFDLDGDGKKPVLGAAELISKEPTCFSVGYQWQHCDNPGCNYGETVTGEKTHKANKVEKPKSNNHKWEKNGNDYVYYFTLYILDPATEEVAKDANGDDLVYTTTAKNIEAAKISFETRYNIVYKDVKCKVIINATIKCEWCRAEDFVSAQSVRPVEHSWIITNETPDMNNPWCSENAVNLCTKSCERCGYSIENFRYYVAHSMALICDDATCTGKKAVYDDCGVEVDEVPWCNNCTHANRRFACYRCGEESVEVKADKHEWVKTDVKIPYFVHPDFGPVYETCMLPARYVYVCDNTFSEGFECECTTWHYDPADFSVLGGGIWDDADNDGKLDLDVIDNNGVHVPGEEYSVGYVENDGSVVVVGRGDIDAIDRVYGHRPHATVDADGNTIIDTTNSGITYKAPTCTTDGSVKGFCTWCSTNINVKIPANAAYHEYVLVEAAVGATCMSVGKTDKYVCEICDDVKGGEVIPVDYSNHVPGCCLFTRPTWIRPASCTTAYAEVYAWSNCGKIEIVEIGYVNPANHVYYDYDDDFCIINSTSFLKTVEFADPTCTTKGPREFTYCTECNYVVNVSDEDLENYGETLDSVGMSSILSAMDAINATPNVAEYDGIAYGKYINEQHVAAYYAANYRFYEIAGKSTGVDRNEDGKNSISDSTFEISALGHDFYFDPKTTSVGGNVLRVYLKETCTTPGHEWKIQCTRCTAIHPELNGETIAPHGLNEQNITRLDYEVPPTCTESGMAAGLYCSLCDAENDLYSNKAEVRAHGQECFVCNGTYKTIPARGHNFTLSAIMSRNYACETYAVKFYSCTDCGYMVGTNFVPAEDHKFITEVNAGGQTVNKLFTKMPDCTKIGYTYYMCNDCDLMWIVDTIPATGHKNMYVTDNYLTDHISFSCINDEYLIYVGTDCEMCGHAAVGVYEEDYVDPSLRGTVICGIQNGNIDHNWVANVVEGGCTAEGTVIYICADCKVIKNDSVHNFVNGVCACGAWENEIMLPPTGHDFGYTVEYVPANSEKSGSWTWVCSKCGEEVVEEILYKGEIPKQDAKIVVESKSVVEGSEFTVAVSLEDNPGFAYFRIVLDYDPNVFTLTNVTNMATDTAMEIGSNLISWDSSTNYTGQELCILTFTVANDVTAGNYDICIHAEECYDEYTYDVNVCSGIGNIQVCIYGDVNGDGVVNGKDVIVMRKHLVGDYDEVSAGADVNGDGDINGKDIIILRKYLVGTATLGPQE